MSENPTEYAGRKAIFDRYAEQYDAARPSYPAELVRAILDYAQIAPDGKILEIGAGTGKATALFAEWDFEIRCLEPGKNLASLAAERLSLFPKVTFENRTFEEWPLEAGAFDLIFAAQAFHWVDPAIGLPKAAQALKPEGTLALFWNMSPDVEGELHEAIQAVYSRHVPEWSLNSSERLFETKIQQREVLLRDSGAFQNIVVEQFPWSYYYDTEAFIAMVDTHSDHQLLPKTTRSLLYDDLRVVLDAHGGSIEYPYVAVLYLGRPIA